MIAAAGVSLVRMTSKGTSYHDNKKQQTCNLGIFSNIGRVKWMIYGFFRLNKFLNAAWS